MTSHVSSNEPNNEGNPEDPFQGDKEIPGSDQKPALKGQVLVSSGSGNNDPEDDDNDDDESDKDHKGSGDYHKPQWDAHQYEGF